MFELLAGAVFVLAGASAYLLGRLSEFRRRNSDLSDRFHKLETERESLLNRVIIKAGAEPVFSEAGTPIINPYSTPTDNPVMQILRPPIAQAELDWEREEEEEREKFTLSNLVPPLSPEQKEQMRANLNGHQ